MKKSGYPSHYHGYPGTIFGPGNSIPQGTQHGHHSTTIVEVHHHSHDSQMPREYHHGHNNELRDYPHAHNHDRHQHTHGF